MRTSVSGRGSWTGLINLLGAKPKLEHRACAVGSTSDPGWAAARGVVGSGPADAGHRTTCHIRVPPSVGACDEAADLRQGLCVPGQPKRSYRTRKNDCCYSKIGKVPVSTVAVARIAFNLGRRRTPTMGRYEYASSVMRSTMTAPRAPIRESLSSRRRPSCSLESLRELGRHEPSDWLQSANRPSLKTGSASGIRSSGQSPRPFRLMRAPQ